MLTAFRNLIFSDELALNTNISDNSNVYTVDFSKEDRLGIDLKLDLVIHSQNDVSEFSKLKEEIENGKFYVSLMQAQRLLQNEDLLGYHDKLALKDFFNDQGSSEQPESDSAIRILDYLSLFQRVIIDNSTDKDLASNLTSIIKLIIYDNY